MLSFKIIYFCSLKSFGSIKKLHNTKFDAGLGAFYTYTDDDECMATEPMIQMPTRISSATEVRNMESFIIEDLKIALLVK